MRVLAFVQQKGGAGKTTLALNLSVAAEAHGERVLIIDLDAQGSACFWSERRGTNKPTVIAGRPEKLSDIVKAATELGASVLVIDVPSRLDDVALAAIRVADLVVCPCPADLLNLHPLRQTVDLIEAAEKLDVTIVVLNDIDEVGAAKKVARAREALEEFKLAIAPTIISHLAVFSTAYDQGKAVGEVRPAGGKAARQMHALWSDLDRFARRIAAPKKEGKATKEARP